MSEDLKALFQNVGNQFAESAQKHLADAWGDIPAEGKAAVKAAAADRARLALRGLAGEEVAAEIAMVESTIADWAWVGADHARSALVEAAKDGAKMLGALLGAMVGGLL